MSRDSKHPCRDCAFRRDSVPNNLGGSPVETYIGQTLGNFYIPCHTRYGEMTDPDWKKVAMQAPQCAGSQIFRANAFPGINHAEQIKSLPADHDLVFSSPAEFIAHHKGITVEDAAITLEQAVTMLRAEMNKADVRVKQ